MTDPAAIHAAALHELRAEADRRSAAIADDDLALTEAARLDAAVEAAQARVTKIDEQLAASGTATAAEELGKVLAALIPHVHTDDCPVCGRDFAEFSREPLSTHLATRVSELAEDRGEVVVGPPNARRLPRRIETAAGVTCLVGGASGSS